MAVVHVTGDTFEQEVLKAEGKVLVDFWAGWCGPCQMLGPVIEEVAVENMNAEPHQGYEYNEVKVFGLLTANAITESVMNFLWSKDVEQKLINDYYASQIGILDTSYADKYKSFLTERNRIKEQINSDFNNYKG